MKSRLRWLQVGVAALGLSMLAACGGGGSGSGEGAGSVLTIAAVNVPGGFDGDALVPGTQNTVPQIYEPLVRYGVKDAADGAREVDPEHLEPGLAESWEVAEDNLSYVFTLREGVQSQWGNELTAEDVKWSWDKSFAQERTGAFIGRVANVESVEVVDQRRVRFNLSAPSPIFLRALTLYVPGIYDSTEMKKHATADDPWALEWIKTNSAGFGPYYVDQVKSGEEAVFKANPNYYGEAPYFTEVVYRGVPEAATRVQLLKAGSVDWIEEVNYDQILDLRDADGVRVQSVAGNLQAEVHMNPNYKPFDNKLVRQAMNYAAPHDQLLQNVFKGLGEQSHGPLPNTVPCNVADEWYYNTDVNKAKELLAKAGYPDGVEVTLEYSGLFWWEEPLAVQLKDGLAKAGIEVNLKRIPDADMTARSAPGKRDMPFFTYYQQPIVMDAGYSLLLTSTPDGSSDRNDYNNPEVTKLITKANTTVDEDERCELVKEAQRTIIDDASWLYVADIGAQEAMAENIEGWVWHPDNQERWYTLHR